jgi:hypothetical protein
MAPIILRSTSAVPDGAIVWIVIGSILLGVSLIAIVIGKIYQIRSKREREARRKAKGKGREAPHELSSVVVGTSVPEGGQGA